MKAFFHDHPHISQGLLLVPALIAVVVLLMRGFLLNRPEEYPVEHLDSGWTVERNGEPVDTGTLSQIDTGDVKRGDTFELARTLPEAELLPSACLYFRDLHSAVRVSLDGEEIYSFGWDIYEAEKMIGRSICFVPLPDDRAGKELRVLITAAEPDAFYGLGPIYYGVEQDLFTHVLKERQYAFYIALFLCIFGIVQLFWLPFLLISDQSNIRLLFSALTTLILGIYLLGYYNLFDLFTDRVNANTMFEYLSLYLIAPSMAGYIASVSDGRVKKVYTGFACLDVCFVIAALALHHFNIVHFIRFLYVSYVLSFTEAVPYLALVFTGWYRRRQTYFDRLEENADFVLASGFFFYVVGSMLDAAVFSVVRFTGGQEATVRIPFVTIGSLLYAFAVSMHYFLHGVVNLRAEATRQRLKDKAYSDALTGLSNRGECELVLEQLGRENGRFVIISMDLDNLKTANDTYGHAEGDRLLRGFAGILQTAFEGCRLIGRMGGDEFLVVLTGEDCDTADDRLKRMREIMDEQNRQGTGVPYSVSYGMARNGDGSYGRRTYDVYMLADARMYDMKRRHR